VQDLYEVVQNEIKPEKKFYFAGSSLGSMIILAYLAEKTIKPEKSLLISPIAQMDYPLWGRIIINYFPPSLYLVIKHVVAWYFKNIKVDKHKEPEQAIKYESTIKGAEPARLKQNAKALAGYSLWPVMCDIDTSVVLIGARTDKVHGIDVLEQICREIPEAEIVLLESNKATHGREAGVLINEFLGH
jgi:alpha-beta hydrolase superfamily lysophospholipase